MKRKYFLLLAIWVFLIACIGSAKQIQPSDTAPSPTITPTYYFVRLPASIQSTSGWKITLSALDLQTNLGETKPKKKMFLVGLVEIENLTGKSDCITSDQFFLQNKLQKIEMERNALEAGKNAYLRDYPGTIIGQCLDANEKKESLLVFDIPATSEELSLNFQDQTILLGKIEAIQNPLPTLPPTVTPTVPPTVTVIPSVTPDLLATNTPLSTPTYTPSQEILSLNNSLDMAALLNAGDCGSVNSEFAEKYSGRTIQFDGYIADIAQFGNDKTRFDFLIFAGNFGESFPNSPNFKFENVNFGDLKLTGANIPDHISEGQNLRITAKVKEYKAISCLFFLEPVSTEIR